MTPEQHAARRLEDQTKQARGIARWLRAQAEEHESTLTGSPEQCKIAMVKASECRRLADDVERFWT